MLGRGPSKSRWSMIRNFTMNQTDERIKILKDVDFTVNDVGLPISLLVGVVGNTLAIITLVRMRNTSGTYFLIALTLADFGVLTSWATFWLQHKFSPVFMNYYDYGCKIVLFVFYSSIHGSVSILVTMTAERFIVVWFPFQAKTICKKKNCIIAIVLVSVVILSINSHNLFTRQLIHIGNGTSVCLESNIAKIDMPHGHFHVYVWPWIDATIYSFFPIISIFTLNTLIIGKIKSADKMTGKNTKESKSQSDQITKTLLIVSFAFLILTSPIGIMLLVEKSWQFQDDPYQYAVWRVLRSIAGLMECMNHSINFFLYCLGGERFRRAVARLFCSCRASPETSSQQTGLSTISKTVYADGNNSN